MLNRIGIKLIAAVGLGIIVIISIYAYVTIQSQERVLLEEVARHSYQLSETIKNSTHFSMLANRRNDTHRIIKSISKEPCIREIRILNKQGTVIYSSDSSTIGHMVDKKAEACYTCHASDEPLHKVPVKDRTRIYRIHEDSSRVFGTITPIYNEPSCWEADCHAHAADKSVLGVLDLTVCLKPVEVTIREAKMKVFFFALAAIVILSFVIALVVHWLINKPVKSLLQATEAVASGNLNYAIRDMGRDELGLLAKSFNNMTKKLSEARQQLFQSDKMASLGRLAAGVAHEINNPLTGILTYSSFLLKRAKNQPDLRDDLNVIVRETKRSREIVKGLLDFARQSVPKKNEADINEVIEKALNVVDNQLTINHIKLKKQLQSDLPPVKIDSNQIQQVFINLIVNAIHAIDSNQGGEITISTSLTTLEPYGITHIKHAVCPKGHELIDHSFKIEGLSSIKVHATSGDREGEIHLDPVYGKNRHEYGLNVAKDKDINVSCYKCDISLMHESKNCPQCGSPIYTIEIPGKGQLEGCLKKNCLWQYWSSVEQEGKKSFIETAISDTGCGIPEENLDKIFEPFFSTKGQKGTGLGLAVIWGIMDNHEGNIKVKSTLGEGTTFTLHLPVTRS